MKTTAYNGHQVVYMLSFADKSNINAALLLNYMQCTVMQKIADCRLVKVCRTSELVIIYCVNKSFRTPSTKPAMALALALRPLL